MQKEDFKKLRKRLHKTQKEMAGLLTISKKTIESYEQGLRNIPANVQRILYFLLFKLNQDKLEKKQNCWNVKSCSPEFKKNCIAWLAKEGFYCWFITGKVCAAEQEQSKNTINSCFECDFFKENLDKIIAPAHS